MSKSNFLDAIAHIFCMLFLITFFLVKYASSGVEFQKIQDELDYRHGFFQIVQEIELVMRTKPEVSILGDYQIISFNSIIPHGQYVECDFRLDKGVWCSRVGFPGDSTSFSPLCTNQLDCRSKIYRLFSEFITVGFASMYENIDVTISNEDFEFLILAEVGNVQARLYQARNR